MIFNNIYIGFLEIGSMGWWAAMARSSGQKIESDGKAGWTHPVWSIGPWRILAVFFEEKRGEIWRSRSLNSIRYCSIVMLHHFGKPPGITRFSPGILGKISFLLNWCDLPSLSFAKVDFVRSHADHDYSCCKRWLATVPRCVRSDDKIKSMDRGVL